MSFDQGAPAYAIVPLFPEVSWTPRSEDSSRPTNHNSGLLVEAVTCREWVLITICRGPQRSSPFPITAKLKFDHVFAVYWFIEAKCTSVITWALDSRHVGRGSKRVNSIRDRVYSTRQCGCLPEHFRGFVPKTQPMRPVILVLIMLRDAANRSMLLAWATV